MTSDPAHDWGTRAARMLARIAQASAPGPGVTRLPFTSEHRAAVEQITGWMQAAGLTVRMDDAGTLFGRRDGTRPDAPVFLMGSHQDSVREGGAFDGIMGVVLPVLALAKLQAEGVKLPFPVEVVAFADEEGVRFPTALIGSRALAGTLDTRILEMRDAEGVSVAGALRDFGLDPDALPKLARDPDSVMGFLECHIEQGPVLETAGEALGVATAICGIERHQVAITGEAGHAGTVPMDLRRDALTAAAEIIGEVERLARNTDGLLGTVGALEVRPNAVNAIPGEVRMSVELRAPEDAVREAAGGAVHDFSKALAERRNLSVEIARSYAQPATVCDPALTDRLVEAAGAVGGGGRRMPSGATHDASAMADLCPVALMFLRCRGGISHTPEEHADAQDMGRAIDAIARFLRSL